MSATRAAPVTLSIILSLSAPMAQAEVPTPEGAEDLSAVEAAPVAPPESDEALEAAKAHYVSGMSAYRTGHFYDAARSFDAAHAAAPRPQASRRRLRPPLLQPLLLKLGTHII